MGKKLILFVVVCFASCGPSAEKIKEDQEFARAKQVGDSLDSVAVSIIKSF